MIVLYLVNVSAHKDTHLVKPELTQVVPATEPLPKIHQSIASNIKKTVHFGERTDASIIIFIPYKRTREKGKVDKNKKGKNENRIFVLTRNNDGVSRKNLVGA